MNALVSIMCVAMAGYSLTFLVIGVRGALRARRDRRGTLRDQIARENKRSLSDPKLYLR